MLVKEHKQMCFSLGVYSQRIFQEIQPIKRYLNPIPFLHLKKRIRQMLKIVSEEGYYGDLDVTGTEDMTDDVFFTFCEKNRRIRIERDQKHQIYILPQISLDISELNCQLSTTVTEWNRSKKGGKVFGSDAGYFLPDNPMRSPDVSWMSNKNWASLSAKEKRQLPYMAPEFVIEIMSATDNLISLHFKMLQWIENGVLLG